MLMIDILIRSISGYVFIVPGVFLYFWYLGKTGKKQTIHHIVTAGIFCYYLTGILTMTGIGKLKPFAPRFQFIPFVDMIRGPVDTILNVILFFPLGFFLPLLYKKYNRIGRIVFIGFLFSLAVELVQMFGIGATDINDLITNTVGVCLGYVVYQLFFKTVRKEFCKKFWACNINEDTEVLFFAVYSFVIMITVQPFVISRLFCFG